MNFLTGTVERDGDGSRLDLGGQSLAVPHALSTFTGPTLRLGVRPEAVEVASEDGVLRGELQVLEPLVSSVLLTTEICGQPVKAQAPPTFRPEPRVSLSLRIPPEACRWYDPETSRLLEVR